MAFYAANERRAPGAAGVSQPWETLACSPVRNAYLQQHSHIQPRAAGVSQPWCATVSARSKTLACASASRKYGGLTPAAPYCVFATFRTMFDSPRAAFGSPTHGGLTPAAPYCVFATFRTMFDSPRAAFGSPTHGGLTPAALDFVFASRWKMFDYRNTSSDQVLRNSPLHQNWGT